MRDISIVDKDEPIEVDITDIKPGQDAGTDSAQVPKVPVEREAFISLSIPPELIAITTIEEPVSPPPSKPVPKCAVKGCNLSRKYKLVDSVDPEMGACGMAHLATLQSVH
jgi:hypothetical protein